MRSRLLSTENSFNLSLFCDVPGHNDQEITHFCCNKDCMTPLCQECIQIHSEYHQEINQVAIFKRFREVKEASFFKLKNFADKVETKLVGLNALLLRSEIEQASGLETLSKCKVRVLSLINSLFDELESNYRILMEQERSKKTKIADQATDQLKSILTDLRSQQESLDSADCIQTIAQVYRTNYDSELEKALIQTNVLELELKGPSGVVVHPDLLSNMSRVLRDYVKIGRSNSDSSQATHTTNATNCGSCLEQSVDIKTSAYFTPNVMSQEDSDFTENLGRISGQEKSEELKTNLPIEGNESLLRSEGPGKVDVKALSTKNMISVYQKDHALNEEEHKQNEEDEEEEKKEGEDRQEQEGNKEDDVDEIMTQQTVFSSAYSEPTLREEEDDGLSSVESNMSENIVFEEIPASPGEGEE